MSEPEEYWDEAEPATAAALPVTAPSHAPWPEATDPETYVLACCLLDQGASLSQSISSGLSSTDFREPAHGLIYSTLRSMATRQDPIDITTLLSALGPRLGQAGGINRLMELSDPFRFPTTTYLTKYVSRVIQDAANRRAVHQARTLIEAAERGEDVGPAPTSGPRKIADILTESRFTSAKLIDKPLPIFTAAGTTICTPGNITALYSQAKAGKTATLGAMIAATMAPAGTVHDTLGFQASNPDNKAVLHFDTEQSRYDWQQMILTAARRIKEPTIQDNICSHLLTGLTAPECRQVLNLALESYSAKYNGIYAVFIDGIGDLVTDVNEAVECNEFIAHLHGMAIKHNCAIIVILHLNPASESKARGHLGSQLERKSESNLMLEKQEDGTTRLYATKQRGRSITKDKAICFRWSDEFGYHVSVKSEPLVSLKGGRPKKYTIAQFTDILPRTKETAQTFRVLLNFARDKTGIKETAFRELLSEAATNGEVIQVMAPGGYVYYMNLPGEVAV